MPHSHRHPTDHRLRRTTLGIVVPLAISGSVLTAPAIAAETPPLAWTTVANAGDHIPGSTKTFNSFNQPSVNTGGLVVFRARSKGPSPDRGVFTRNAAAARSPIVSFLTAGGTVPQPNNLDATFNEFPSFPRISTAGSSIATRGQSQPVWEYTLDGTDTRVGTSGVYARVDGTTVTGASLLGAVPGYEYYAVPGAAAGTRFDQFPGAPSIDGTTIAFKGNYTEDGDGKTGVYVRDLSSPGNPVRLIANSDTRIPNQPANGDLTFGSTAPPSAAAGKMVFVGLDNEEQPTLGGIYLARTSGTPTLRTLVAIGGDVPSEDGQTFAQLGESLSFDGRYVAFWGAWGDQARQITLTCATDGNAQLLQFCKNAYPDGYTTTVPVHQGIFVYDTQTGQLRTAATTGVQFQDFLYWVYSGRVPGTGEGDEDTLEGPRWRSSAFMAVSGNGSAYQVAFKASPTSDSSGIYLTAGPGSGSTVTIVDTSTNGAAIDSEAEGTTVTSVGLERDGFRGRWLAVSVSMANADATLTWAGVYATRVPTSLGS